MFVHHLVEDSSSIFDGQKDSTPEIRLIVKWPRETHNNTKCQKLTERQKFLLIMLLYIPPIYD